MAAPVKHYGKWRIRWTAEQGGKTTRHSATFDDYNTAKRELALHEAETEQIRRGELRAVPADKTFNELFDYWLAHRAPKKRSFKDDVSVIRKHLRPAFGELRLRDLTIEHIDNFVDDRDNLDPKTVNNHLTLLRTTLGMARDELEWIRHFPKFKKPSTRLFDKDFRYLRNDDEITRFLAAARGEGQMAFMLCATALYGGMRAGELGGLQWGDVDFDRRLISVQRSFCGPTKSGDVRYVPIVDALLPLLREWRLRNPGRLVFSNRDGEMLRESGRLYQEVFHRILDAAEFPKEEKANGHARRYITFHGLRHTFASHWVMNGGDIFKLQKVLGHKSIQMTMRYAHLAPHAFTEDWGRFGGAPTNAAEVIPLARRRRA